MNDCCSAPCWICTVSESKLFPELGIFNPLFLAVQSSPSWTINKYFPSIALDVQLLYPVLLRALYTFLTLTGFGSDP